MPTLAHTHTYVKYWPNKWKNKTLFKCDDPHCTHFEERSMILGKAALCASCGKEFILDRDALRRVRPRCVACSDTKKGQEIRAVRDLLASIHVDPQTGLLDIEEITPNEFDDPQGGL